MSPSLDDVVSNFDRNVRTVLDLLEFDAYILKLVERQIGNLDSRLKAYFHAEHGADAIIPAHLSAESTLQQLRAIKSNESLKPKYQIMHSQCLVLLVSFFGSSARDLFRAMVRRALTTPGSRLDQQTLELSVHDLRAPEFDLSELVALRLEETKRLSFQDMRSAGQAYALIVGKDIDRDRHINNIVVAQAGRHVIVHADGIVDHKMMSQIRDALPRDIKVEIRRGEPLSFSRAEIEQVALSMREYLQRVRSLSAESPS